MHYSVVPFVATVSNAQGSSAAATQLQTLVNDMAGKGFEYVSLESVQTVVAGNPGCFGFGSTPSVLTSFSMVVFKR